MHGRALALLVGPGSQAMESLEKVLRDLTVDTRMVGKPDEAGRLLAQIRPDIIFTDTLLSQGSWVDVLRTNNKAERPSHVVVVHPTNNIELYVTVMEKGAFNFVVPPFEPQGLAQMIRSAQLKGGRRAIGHSA